MAEGGYEEPRRTGRVSVPTEKLKALQQQDAEKIFWRTAKALDRFGKTLDKLIDTCNDPVVFKDQLIEWMKLCSEVRDAEHALLALISKERLAEIKPMMEKSKEKCLAVKRRAYQHLDVLQLSMHKELKTSYRVSPQLGRIDEEDERLISDGHSPTIQTLPFGKHDSIPSVRRKVSSMQQRTEKERSRHVQSHKHMPEEIMSKMRELEDSIQNLENDIAHITLKHSRSRVTSTPINVSRIPKESSPAGADDYTTPLKVHIPVRKALTEIPPMHGYRNNDYMESPGTESQFMFPPRDDETKGRIQHRRKRERRLKPDNVPLMGQLEEASRLRITEEEMKEDMLAWQALKRKYAIPREGSSLHQSLREELYKSNVIPNVCTPVSTSASHLDKVATSPPPEFKDITYHEPPAMFADSPKVPPTMDGSDQASLNMYLATAIMKLSGVLEGKEKDNTKDVSNDDKVKLPALEPSIFQGDKLGFQIWLNSFVTLIEGRISCPLRRLFYLSKYVGGKAKDAIKELLDLSDDVTAYSKAMIKLKERYGSPIMIADAFKNKIKTWPNIKAGDYMALQSYADFLSHCHTAMKSTKYLAILAEPEENAKMASKLPEKLLDDWNRKVVQRMYPEDEDQESTYPTFKEFCTFMATEARVAAGPCAPKVLAEGRKTKALATNSGTSVQTQKEDTQKNEKKNGRKKKTPLCLMCKDITHWLNKCPKFLELNPEKRREYCMNEVICFGCLRKGHDFSTCNFRHNRLLTVSNVNVSDKSSKTAEDTTQKVGEPLEKKTPTVSHSVLSNKSTQHYSTVVAVKVSHVNKPSTYKLVYALLDSQSDGCFVATSVMDMLGIQGTPIDLELITMEQRSIVKCMSVEGLTVQGIHQDKIVALPECYSKDDIPVNRDSIARPSMVRTWSHLEEAAQYLQPYSDDIPIGLLIGYNCVDATFPEETIKKNPSVPWATQTALGWTVQGKVNFIPDCGSTFCLKTQIEVKESDLQKKFEPKIVDTLEPNIKLIKKVFDVEFSGTDTEEKRSYEDVQFLRIMEESFRINEEGHVELPLPVREDAIIPEGVKNMAYRRFKNTEKKCRRDEKQLTAHLSFFGSMFEQKHAEIAPKLTKKDILAWWLPFQVVYHPRKPDKPRVVYDASAEVEGICLNDILLPGPDLTNNLVGVLLRFREALIAFLCDIKGMFHQVVVAEAWRNLMRFFWYLENDPSKPVVEYRVTVHLFGATSSPACATFALQKIADIYESEFGLDIASFIKNYFYVDDGLRSVPDLRTALHIMFGSHEMCLKGGFRLHEFASNDREVMKNIPKDLRSKDFKEWEDDDDMPMVVALGTHWRMQTDTLHYIIKLTEEALTRREMLSAVGSIYDPLGIIAPVLLKGRRILQDLCHQKLTWDQLVSPEVQNKWNEWYLGLKILEDLQIPRCYLRNVLDVEAAELHVFCDGSDDGYGTASYLVLEDDQKNRDVTLVQGKSRVKPIKKTTTPRMELQAAVLAAKMAVFLKSELPEYPRFVVLLWSDSMIILAYITNSGTRYKIYVANRVQSIRDRTEPKQWNHVASADNPADLASRGCLASEIVGNKFWFEGPEFLRNPIQYEQKEYVVPEDDPEVLKEKVVLSTRIRCTHSGISVMESLEKCSTWNKIIRTMLIWRRYIRKCFVKAKANIKTKIPEHRNLHEFEAVEERRFVQMYVVRQVQGETFPVEMKLLDPGYPLSMKACKEQQKKIAQGKNLKQLDVFMCSNDKVLKVGGRIRRADLPVNDVHPIIMPTKSIITERLVMHYHVLSAHVGRYSVIHLLRAAGWWIIKARSTVDSVLKTCVDCKRMKGKIITQKMADLPNDRLEMVPAFTYCGIDFFGPFYVKEKRSMVKRWACLFTCLIIRAVHVEICHSMTTDSFLLAYRRFIGIRGPVRSIRCDRGSNIMGAKGDLDLEFAKIDQNRVKAHLLNDDCDWTTIIPNAPKASHMGGVWERMIGTVRRNLEFLLLHHGHRLTDESLITFMAEAVAIVNNRPLTYVDMTEPQELQAISPSMLLTMKFKKVLKPFKKSDKELSEKELCAKRAWDRVQYLAEVFWDRWKKDYLPVLTQRSKWQKEHPNLQENDIVLLVDESVSRSHWPLARVVSVKTSEDGLVRTIMIRTKDGIYCRPVRKVVMLYRPSE